MTEHRVVGLFNGFAIGVAFFIAGSDACTPLPKEPAVTRQLELSQCRKWSEQYRDAGLDAEMAAYDKCAEKVK